MIRSWFDRLANRGLALFVSAIVLTVVAVSLVNMAISRQELEEQARSQVATVAEMLAYELDRKLIERFGVLTEAASAVSMDAVSFRQFSGLIMERQRPVSHLFEHLFLFDPQGRVLESYPEVAELEGANLSGRAYFRDTIDQLTPQISEPFTSYIRELPTVVMTAPVFDHNGALVGVLSGSIVLTSNNFLSEISTTGIGNEGYITLASRSGLVLVQEGYLSGIQTVAPDNPADRAATEGFEGVTEGVSRDGEPAMVAVQQLNMAPWFVSATWPLDDAYAPANRLGENLAWIAIMVVLVMLPFSFFLFRRYLNPLRELADQIHARHLGIREQPVEEVGYQEIRELAEAFNRVMSDRTEVEARLRAEQQRGDSILGALQEGVVMTDTLGNIRYANLAAGTFLGRVDDLVGAHLFELVSFETGHEQWSAAHFLDSDEIHGMDGVLRNQRDQSLDVEITVLHVSRGEPDERLVFVIRDDSERRRQEQQLSWQATHDSLTGLLNRRAFSAELVKWLAQASTLEVPTVLMLIDLDHFKPVNDEGGHLLGDELLRKLADILRQAVRKTDAVARFGGDEFAILLPACGLDRGTGLAEQVRSDIEKLKLAQQGRQFGVTASIGLTDLSAGDSSPREALARADEGAYAAKARGRNQVVAVPSADA
ncbi:diguanylate cyclase [Marinobacter bryozoorum]|uniref:sensor domain-containing diguanylate cyclase n=1 Tax=Marinobacter bryozoorum TaxID=256324 RepID=UPI00200611F5|nr:diguanylate cyclase [Marinobacter bryozoorum]MCK7544142.1 diguanylate cyclase [Marinobacter bryozoorum]